MELGASRIDSENAKRIATRFLEQSFSVVEVKSFLKGNEWKVMALVGLPNKQVKVVSIDIETGRIVKCVTTNSNWPSIP